MSEPTPTNFPCPGYDAQTDARAWLNAFEIEMFDAVTRPGITCRYQLKFQGDAGDHAGAWMDAHSRIPAFLHHIAALRKALHVARGGVL